MKQILLIIALFCSAMAPAQKYWNSSRADHILTLGLRGGINFAKLYNNGNGSDKDFRLGYMGGIELDINFIQSLSVNTGIYYSQKGYKSEYSDYRGSYIVSDNASYINIPFLASYRVKLSDAAQFQLNVGPYFAFGVSGKQNVESTFPGQEDYRIDSFDEYDGLKKSDIGLHVGAGIVYSHIYMGVSYERGLKNVSNETDSDFHNGCIGINLGYNF
ncbi:MAG: PorT family protein [Prevotella sp.]|nr:PorT family protein [Prevotella sp.]